MVFFFLPYFLLIILSPYSCSKGLAPRLGATWPTVYSMDDYCALQDSSVLTLHILKSILKSKKNTATRIKFIFYVASFPKCHKIKHFSGGCLRIIRAYVCCSSITQYDTFSSIYITDYTLLLYSHYVALWASQQHNGSYFLPGTSWYTKAHTQIYSDTVTVTLTPFISPLICLLFHTWYEPL